MPAVVASHFIAGGNANGFMPRWQYVAFMITLVVAVPSTVFLAGAFAPRLPARFINLPNKQCWLAPERQAATLASVGKLLVWSAYVTLGLLCLVHWFVVQANLVHPPHLEQAPLVGATALFFAALFVGMIVVLRRFFRVP